MHRRDLSLLLCTLLLLLAPVSAGETTASFERSVHEGTVDGTGVLAGMSYYGVRSGSATLSFEEAGFEQVWNNQTVQTSQTDSTVNVGEPARDTRSLGATTLHLATNQDDAILMVFGDARSTWDAHARRGTLAAPDAGTVEMEDQVPLARSGTQLTVPLEGTSLWRSTPVAENTVTGDFWVSLFGWTAADEDGVLFQTGRSNVETIGVASVEDLSGVWLHVRGGTLTIDFADGAAADTFVHDPIITTDGTTTLTGLPTQPSRVIEGTSTLAVTSSGDHLEAVVRDAVPTGDTEPATTAFATPAGSVWLWGGLGAVVFVALFVFVALAARSTPMLEWRSYHALDRHRPRLAAFWANLWTRRDPWDGHAWSARGEARMLMNHDRGAARDFTKAHALLPPEERAVNALHAARSHARVGHATQAAHWISIVASHDINVLLTAREEPDFARVWDHESVQRAVQQVLGVGA